MFKKQVFRILIILSLDGEVMHGYCAFRYITQINSDNDNKMHCLIKGDDILSLDFDVILKALLINIIY